jgi:hypothetical protein
VSVPRPLLRTLAVLAGSAILLGPGAAAAVGQDQAAQTPAASDEVFDPGQTQEVQGTEAEEASSDEPLTPEDSEETAEEEPSNETIQQAGWGSAADQTPEAKRVEAQEDCQSGAAPPISRMLGLPGSIGGSEAGSVGWLVLAIAAGALLVAGIAFALRHRRGAPAPRGSLETVATVVGILGAVAGLAVQFVPGIGVHEPPAPAATMLVTDIHTRITAAEYARKTDSDPPPEEDRRQVGNVVWLEIQLEGYGDKDPFLQYGLYDPDAGGALLPGTAKRVPVPPSEDQDKETQFLPVWVGYPLSERFVARFRLLDGNRVQAMASTPRMKASEYRYSCPE